MSFVANEASTTSPIRSALAPDWSGSRWRILLGLQSLHRHVGKKRLTRRVSLLAFQLFHIDGNSR